MSDIKVGGYGPGGCDCAIQADRTKCPVHGEHGKIRKAVPRLVDLLLCGSCGEYGVVEIKNLGLVCMKCDAPPIRNTREG